MKSAASFRFWRVVGMVVLISMQVSAQDTAALKDRRAFRKMDIFPAISYAPETRLTLGVIGFRYFDLGRGDLNTPISNVEFLAVYTLAKQSVFESRWELFSTQSRWRYRGELQVQRYPDRNYGIGNDAGVLIVAEEGEGNRDTLNYLYFNSDRIKFSPVVLRQVHPNLYFGLQGDLEYLFRYKVIPTSYYFVNGDSSGITDLPVTGLRSGIGFQLLFDNRDNVINPRKGTFIELNNRHYGGLLGSDFTFHAYGLELRQFINPWQNHTLALRGIVGLEYTDDVIPMRALSRVGGHKFLRGYFKGTYQDNHMLAFEAEYRLPLWRDDSSSKLWQVWKRLGVVGFLGGAQVFNDFDALSFDRFNFAAGGGVRILFNKESRVNIRVDYAVALRNNSGGPGKRQSGLYFFLGEAF